MATYSRGDRVPIDRPPGGTRDRATEDIPLTRYYVDVVYRGRTPPTEIAKTGWPVSGTYGPFTDHVRAEQAVVALAGRADVLHANVRDPSLNDEELD